MIMLPCRCADEYEGPNNADYTTSTTATDYNDQNGYRQNVLSYANAGGRVFTSHWGREWIERVAEPSNQTVGTCDPNGSVCVNDSTQTQCLADGCTWGGGCVTDPTCVTTTGQAACRPPPMRAQRPTAAPGRDL